LPHAGSELCFFFYSNDQSVIPDCLSFSADPHARHEVRIYRYGDDFWVLIFIFGF
jgi:hypothetical protein